MKKRIYKIEEGKKLAGVCGGVAEYFEFDPTLVRIAWIIFTLFVGTGLIAYILMAIVMPTKSQVIKEAEIEEQK